MTPKSVIFCCSWSSYPGLQLSESLYEDPGKQNNIIISMCSGRVSAELILEAFKNDAWGVMIASCPKEKCEHDANYKTRRRIILLQKMLEQIGIEPERIKLEWIDKGEAAKLEKAINDFNNDLKELGPIEIAI